MSGIFVQHRRKVIKNHRIMTKNVLEIEYERYESLNELSVEDRELAEAAVKAVSGSYAPYSKFNVGAAVRLSDGQIITGANQENAAYPSGLCAERTAMFAASAQHPELDIRSLAVAGGLDGQLEEVPASPCGACRQVMAQYQRKAGAPLSVLITGADKVWKFERVDDILPFIFESI